MKDYYAVLDMAPDASSDEIKTQYHFLLQAWHPDKFRDEPLKAKAAAKTREIIEAYKVLGDLKRRRAYDAQRQAEARRRAEQRRESERAEAEEAQRAYEEHPRHQDPPAGFPFQGGLLGYTRAQVMIAGIGLLVLVGCWWFFAGENRSSPVSPPRVTEQAPREERAQAALRREGATIPRHVVQETGRDSGSPGEGQGTAAFLWSVVKGLAKVVWWLVQLVFGVLKFFVVLGANFLSEVDQGTDVFSRALKRNAALPPPQATPVIPPQSLSAAIQTSVRNFPAGQEFALYPVLGEEGVSQVYVTRNMARAYGDHKLTPAQQAQLQKVAKGDEVLLVKLRFKKEDSRDVVGMYCFGLGRTCYGVAKGGLIKVPSDRMAEYVKNPEKYSQVQSLRH